MAIAMCEPHEQPVLGATCRAQWEQESSIPPMVLRDPMEQLISSPAPAGWQLIYAAGEELPEPSGDTRAGRGEAQVLESLPRSRPLAPLSKPPSGAHLGCLQTLLLSSA